MKDNQTMKKVEKIWRYIKEVVEKKLDTTAPEKRWELVSLVLSDYYNSIDQCGYDSEEAFIDAFYVAIYRKITKEFAGEFITTNFYYPEPELGPKYIHGVNPSIVTLVHALLSWGVHTTGSHAGFFPGDEEEQEYWVQRQYLEENGLGTHFGPIVCSGLVHDPPHVFFTASKMQLARLRQLLTPGWIIKPQQPPNHYQLKYTDLQPFSDATNQFWDKFNLKVPEASLPEVDDDAINAQYQAAMPLTPKEYQAERTKAVNALALAIYQDIPNQDITTVKAWVDDYLITLEKKRQLELRTKYLEARLKQLGYIP